MKAVAERGPESPTTRHVLLTLALHMEAGGTSCHPSTTTLARETGLTDRSVREHLIRAEKEGWIGRRKRGRVYHYTPRIPERGSGVQGGEPRKEVPGSEGETPEGGSGVGAVENPSTPEARSGVSGPEESADTGSTFRGPRKEVPGQVGKQLGRAGNGLSNNLPSSESPGGQVVESNGGGGASQPWTPKEESEARDAILDHLHLGEDVVRVEDQEVGLGLEILKWRDLAKRGVKTGEFEPRELTGAITVVRQEAAEDGRGFPSDQGVTMSILDSPRQRPFLNRCLHRFRKSRDQ